MGGGNIKRFIVLLILVFLLIPLLTGCSNNDISVVYSDIKVKKALEHSIEKIGCPYVWGGDGPDEFDCSGLIIWAYNQIDKDRLYKIGNEFYDDATMDDIYNYNIDIIPPQKLRPGDLVFITNDEEKVTHGGLFVEWVEKYEVFNFINASSYYNQVVIDDWPVHGVKREQWFVGAGRMLKYYTDSGK